MSGIVPIKGQDFEVLEAAFGGKNKVTATIDNNKDGVYNYGKTEGDTIKVFDFQNGTATGHHLVKWGELGYTGCTKAGNVDTTTVPLGRCLKKTFKGLNRKEIESICKDAKFIDKNKDGKFNDGDSIILYSNQEKYEHVIHLVKSGELPETTAILTGTDDLSKVKSDNGIMTGEVVWHSKEK